MENPNADRFGVLHVDGQILLNAGPSPRGEHGRLIMLTCPWRWAAIKRGVREVHSPALVQGSLVHVGCAQLYARRMAREHGADPEMYMNPENAILYVAKKEDQALLMAGAEEYGIWGAYVERATAATHAVNRASYAADWRVAAVEHLIEMWAHAGGWVHPPPDAFERRRLARSEDVADQIALIRLGPPYLVTARIDLIRETRAGRFEIVDHKTTGRIDQAKMLGFDLSGQVIQITIWGAAAYGDRYGGTLIHAIEIPRSPVDGKGRATVIKTREWAVAAVPGIYDTFAQRVEDAERRLARLVEEGRPLDRWTRALAETGPCWDRYGACGMRKPCMEGA